MFKQTSFGSEMCGLRKRDVGPMASLRVSSRSLREGTEVSVSICGTYAFRKDGDGGAVDAVTRGSMWVSHSRPVCVHFGHA